MLIVEYLAGVTRADRLEVASLPAAETLELARILCSVLERIHASGILHRDLKPSNIGYTEDGVAKLLDFGLAQLASDPAQGSPRAPELRVDDSAWNHTRASFSTRGFLGTPLYMSPEAILGAEPAPSFDLWSAAIVLYEAVTGTNPVERETGPATYDAIVHARIDDVRERAPDCPAGLAELIGSSLQPDLGARPRSARELSARLAAVS
jgi:serine/threonine-protein kinase